MPTVLALLLALAVQAGETAPDPIGDLVRDAASTPPPSSNSVEDEDAAESLGLPSGPIPYTALPPSPPRSSLPMSSGPLVRLPPRPQGLLDGGWLLSQPDGTQLYGFQFNDLGGGEEVEGAWRDLRREWSSLGSGPVLSVSYETPGLVIRFYERGRAELSVVSLRQNGPGEWVGEMQAGGAPAAVVMRRN